MKEKTAFDDAEVDSSYYWEGSTAQEWCTKYYNKLPDSVKSTIIGVRTTETESGGHFYGINNIDGTGSGAKDKVFFLSTIEYMNYREPAGISQIDGVAEGKGQKWLLRSYGTDCSDVQAYVALIMENGEIKNFGVSWPFYARPAFNLNIPDDVCAVKAEKDGVTKWTVDMNAAEHKSGEATYIWSDDNKTCTAQSICDKCGEIVASESVEANEEVLKKASYTEEGLARYTANFSNGKFTAQTREAAIPKLAVRSGDKKVVSGSTFRVMSVKSRTVSLAKAKNVKRYTVPSTVKIAGKSYKVTKVEGKSLRGSKIRTVTVGKNVKTLKKYAFSKSKATNVVLKTKLLKKSTVKGCLRGSRVKTIRVSVGSKSASKKMAKAYKRIFTKSNAGRSVTVR